jgi:hypothetical protein
MAATVFWTWLWGPVGLLLATPLTTCVVVVGRHIPQFGFLNLMLGAEPALNPGARMYQRLLSHEFREAAQLAESHCAEHGEAALYEEMLIPALRLAERDRAEGALTPSAARSLSKAFSACSTRWARGANRPEANPRSASRPRATVPITSLRRCSCGCCPSATRPRQRSRRLQTQCSTRSSGSAATSC